MGGLQAAPDTDLKALPDRQETAVQELALIPTVRRQVDAFNKTSRKRRPTT